MPGAGAAPLGLGVLGRLLPLAWIDPQSTPPTSFTDPFLSQVAICHRGGTIPRLYTSSGFISSEIPAATGPLGNYSFLSAGDHGGEAGGSVSSIWSTTYPSSLTPAERPGVSDYGYAGGGESDFSRARGGAASDEEEEEASSELFFDPEEYAEDNDEDRRNRSVTVRMRSATRAKVTATAEVAKHLCLHWCCCSTSRTTQDNS